MADVLRGVFAAVLGGIQLLLLAGLLYYYALLIASAFRFRMRSSTADLPSLPRFAIAIPAHNEALVLPATLSVLAKQDYPRELWDVYVVADHCTDRTAEVVRAHGALCLERETGPRGRKAYALAWLLEQILAGEREYTAIVVLDADSQPVAGFLRALVAPLHEGNAVLQGQHVIVNPDDSHFAALAAVDMRLNNLLRNRAKSNLGLSGRLMGDAMCFTVELLRRYGWPADSLTEDREYGLFLLTQGLKTVYVPAAISYGQAAFGWGDAATQRLRWYDGMQSVRRRYALKLLGLGVRRFDAAALDMGLELVFPPFSVLALATLILWIGQGVFSAWPWLLPWSWMLACVCLWILFPFLGLWIDRAPGRFYTLLYGPFYLIWRLGLGLRAFLKHGRVPWVRTRRREEIT